jgi:hypothetical protein
MPDRPQDLRRINEIQHRVSAGMRDILLGDAEVSFQLAMATWVLGESGYRPQHLLDENYQCSGIDLPGIV